MEIRVEKTIPEANRHSTCWRLRMNQKIRLVKIYSERNITIKCY
jgi:hypothetical protein